MTDQQISLEQKWQLVDLLLRIRDLGVPDVRQLVVSEMENELGRNLGVGKYDNARHAIVALLNECMGAALVRRRFLKIIKGLFPHEHAVVVDLERLIDEIDRPPLLSQDQRELLVGLVGGIASIHVRDAFHDVIGPPAGLEPPTEWRDTDSVVGRAESSSGSLQFFLMFVERLAHAADDNTLTQRLHEWIHDTGRDLDPVVLRSLCRVRPDVAGGQPRGVEADSMSHDDAVQSGKKHGKDLSDKSDSPGEEAVNRTSVIMSVQPVSDGQLVIWGGVPARNRDFTGRGRLIEQLRGALVTSSKASVVPQTLYGLGGVGKTQLAVEYVYRYADRYDLIWWVPAEQATTVRESLAMLGARLNIPPSADTNQTAVVVLDALVTTHHRWLLVYDNADRPEDIAALVPSAGGHVILTSRDQEWTHVFDAIEVDVFDRAESKELLRKRGDGISDEDANRLADKLGDLPLALEQAASWHAATGMSIARYLELFDAHVDELLRENQPANYAMTVSASLSVAFEKLRDGEVPPAAQMLELFAFLGPEPISAGLLRGGRGPDVSLPLQEALNDEIKMNRAIRELRRCGLAKVDPNGQKMQVHRLIQLVMRDGLRDDRRERSQANVRRILATANPGSPDEARSWPIHAEIGPHILPADLIGADAADARQVVLDQVRYLFRRGEYAGSRDLAEQAVGHWSRPLDEGGLGPDHEHTLLANRHLANALRLLGHYKRAREIDEDTLVRLRRSSDFGEYHEHTFAVGLGLGVDLRLAGDLVQAHQRDQENLERSRRTFGDDDSNTLIAKNNVAASLRMLGDYLAAYDIDAEVVEQWRQTLSDNHPRTLWAISNLARDLYGLGRYVDALEMQQKAWPTHSEQLGARHNEVLLAARTIAIALRKVGQYGEALTQARDNHNAYNARFGAEHEHTLAATMSYANTLRAVDEVRMARSLATEAVATYQRIFGARHPLALAAATNLGIVLRAAGEHRQARTIDQETYDAMREVLGEEHPHTLCAANSVANNLVIEHRLDEARDLTQHTLAVSRRVRGEEHPYTLVCAVNAARDLIATGDDTASGKQRLADAIDALGRSLGPEHPETLHAIDERRLECDIEPPPT